MTEGLKRKCVIMICWSTNHQTSRTSRFANFSLWWSLYTSWRTGCSVSFWRRTARVFPGAVAHQGLLHVVSLVRRSRCQSSETNGSAIRHLSRPGSLLSDCSLADMDAAEADRSSCLSCPQRALLIGCCDAFDSSLECLFQETGIIALSDARSFII